METRLPDHVINSLEERFGEQINVNGSQPKAIHMKTNPSLLKELAEHVCSRLKGRFVTCAATDLRKDMGLFHMVYIFSLDQDQSFLCIKMDMDPQHDQIDSITPIIPGANWAERELHDMSGIRCQGHPDLRRLVLADDWPMGEHPLREDFAFDYKPAPTAGVSPGLKPLPASTTLLPLGSFYAQKETTAYFNLFIYGEKVVDVDYRGFYNHRGLEKMADSLLNYDQIIFAAERICACCGFSHSTCYCQALEAAAHIEVPIRAKFIRTLLLEIERLYSHSLWLASLCNMEGLKNLFIKCCTLQQHILEISQVLTGNRIIFGMNTIGGVRKDIPKENRSHLNKLINRTDKQLKAIIETLQEDLSFSSQMKMISNIPLNDAEKFCVVGQAARASGIKIDARIDHPYAAYKDMKMDPVCRDEGDNLARISIRLDEMNQSVSLIRETLEKMPDGEINRKVIEIPPHTDSFSAVESPRGETVHYVLTGENNRPLRWKIKSATFSNLQVVPAMLRGTNIADARISIHSLDPCFSCIEH